MSNGEGPIFHGWNVPTRRTMTLYLPITMPGYGVIEDEEGWLIFIAWLREEQAALTRIEATLDRVLDDTDNSYDTTLLEQLERAP